MKRSRLILLLLLMVAPPSFARPMHIVVTYPYIGDIVERIGGGSVRVFVLARGDYNPHVIIPRPSFIAQIRRADLLIISGAQLEIGWLPPLLRQANNPVVQPGERGFLDLSGYVTLIEVPASVSREKGDIHPEGNPHYYLDPYNIPLLATAVMKKLAQLDPQNGREYGSRCEEFLRLWALKLEEWKLAMAPLAGIGVVEYHKNYDYFLRRYDLRLAGTVEPLPGIPPTSKHIEQLEARLANEPTRLILQDVYNPNDASRHIAGRLGMKLVIVPHDIGSVREVTTIIALFDEIVRRVTE